MLRQEVSKKKFGVVAALIMAFSLGASSAFAATDNMSYGPGFESGSGLWYNYGYGPNLGYLVPNTTSDGKTVRAFWLYVDTQTGYSYVGLTVDGFTSNPGAGWLQSISHPNGTLTGNNASFFCTSGAPVMCNWTWPYTYVDLSTSGTVSITHP